MSASLAALAMLWNLDVPATALVTLQQLPRLNSPTCNMKIIPYKSFGIVQLGCSETAVVEQLGTANERVINKVGELELHYESLVVRLDASCGVVEITSRPEVVALGEHCISRHDLPKHLQQLDPTARECYGFMISCKYGVAVDTDTVNDGWISVFVKGRWDEFLR